MMYCVKVVMMVAVLSSTLEIGYGQSIGFGGCPNMSVVSNFDIKKYAGRWYEVERTCSPSELFVSCVTSDYVAERNSLFQYTGNAAVTNTMKDWRGRVSSVTGEAIPLDKTTKQAKYLVSFTGESHSTPYWVLDTDYVTYSVVYSCRSIMGLTHIKYLWILSRTPELTDTVLDNVKSVLQQNNLTSINLKKTNQKNCDYPKPTS